MTAEERLAALKIDLGITATEYDNRLAQYLTTAEARIQGEGVTLDPNDLDHESLVISYASWLWRKRDTGEGMPRMVRYQLNNLIFHQHTESE